MLWLLCLPAAAWPQRYGRPYSLAAIPQLLLQINVQKKAHYFSVYDLRKMPRSVVTETDPTTKQTHVYEGVALDQLGSIGALGSGGGALKIEFGSHQTQTISGRDLETGTKLIVVDKVDGKPISPYAPYDFVAELRGKPALTLTDVQSITIQVL